MKGRKMGVLIFGRHRVRMLLCCSIIFFCFFISSAQQIQREQQEMEYYRGIGLLPLTNGPNNENLPAGSYIITHDIIVEKGKALTLVAGSTIYFTQNAMLVVNGKLICSGSPDAPVIFRRLDNQKYFEPIDSRVETRWDGIYLPDSAQLEMSYSLISDSKYGIVVSGKDVSMVFNLVRFANNKFQNVKIGNREMKISENSPIVFRYPEQKGVFKEPAPVVYATETIQNNRKKLGTSYPKLRVAMGITGGAGLIVGLAGVGMYNNYYNEYKDSKDEKDKSNMNIGKGMAIAGGLLFGIGAVGFTWTFFF